MKKVFLFVMLAGLYVTSFGQHIIPVEISTDPENIEIAVFGAGTVDGGSAAFVESFSSKADFGFVLNTSIRRASGKNGVAITSKQFIVNINPVIIDWNSLDINTVSKTSIDEFSVQRMPFAEDCFLHIGLRSNRIAKVKGGGALGDQKVLHSLWADMSWRPYTFQSQYDSVGVLAFQVFNVTAGYQYNFFKTNVPTIETFMIGFSPQLCFMGINEAEANQGLVEAAAAQVSALQVISPINAGKPEIFGLDKPAYVITIEFSGGKKHTLEVGDATPTNSGYYVRVDKDKMMVTDLSGIDSLVQLGFFPPYLNTPTALPPTLTPVPATEAVSTPVP